jgi:hypothetical protein
VRPRTSTLRDATRYSLRHIAALTLNLVSPLRLRSESVVILGHAQLRPLFAQANSCPIEHRRSVLRLSVGGTRLYLEHGHSLTYRTLLPRSPKLKSTSPCNSAATSFVPPHPLSTTRPHLRHDSVVNHQDLGISPRYGQQKAHVFTPGEGRRVALARQWTNKTSDVDEKSKLQRSSLHLQR